MWWSGGNCTLPILDPPSIRVEATSPTVVWTIESGSGQECREVWKEPGQARRSGEALELAANTRKCGMRTELRMCVGGLGHFGSRLSPLPLPPQYV